MKLVYQYMAIFFGVGQFFHPLQITFIHYKPRIAIAIPDL